MKIKTIDIPRRIGVSALRATIRRSFTLIELLVVIGIVILLATITLIAVQGIVGGARLANAQNTIVAALDNARALAMKENQVVLVAFRSTLINDEKEVVEVVTARFSGDTYVCQTLPGSGIVDRFEPIPDVPVRTLPVEIKVAAPHYISNIDELWLTSTNFAAIRRHSEMAGAIIGVMYGPDGSIVRDNPRSDSIEVFVDFNNDRLQRQGGGDFDNVPALPGSNFPNNTGYCDFGTAVGQFPGPILEFYCQAQVDDEPYVILTQFLAVYNDEEAREDPRLDQTQWQDGTTRIEDLSLYINEFADRIHFNRYTGVVMK